MALTPKLVKDAETDLVDIGEIASGPVEPGFVTTRFGGPIKTLRRLMADMEQEAAGPISEAISAAEILRDQTQAFLAEALAIAASGNNAAAIAARARVDKNLEDLTDKEAANRNLGTFATRALAQAATIPAILTTITLRGYSAPGDGGGALYKRVVSEPEHLGKFQSADGQWWEAVRDAVAAPVLGADPTQALEDMATMLDQGRLRDGHIPLLDNDVVVTRTIAIRHPGVRIAGNGGATYNRGRGKRGWLLASAGIGRVLDLGASRTYVAGDTGSDQWEIERLNFRPAPGVATRSVDGVAFTSRTNGPDRGAIFRSCSFIGLKDAITTENPDLETQLATLVIDGCVIQNCDSAINAKGNLLGLHVTNSQIEQNGGTNGVFKGSINGPVIIKGNMLEGQANVLAIEIPPRTGNRPFVDFSYNYLEANSGDYVVRYRVSAVGSIVVGPNYAYNIPAKDYLLFDNTASSVNVQMNDPFPVTFKASMVLIEYGSNIFGPGQTAYGIRWDANLGATPEVTISQIGQLTDRLELNTHATITSGVPKQTPLGTALTVTTNNFITVPLAVNAGDLISLNLLVSASRKAPGFLVLQVFDTAISSVVRERTVSFANSCNGRWAHMSFPLIARSAASSLKVRLYTASDSHTTFIAGVCARNYGPFSEDSGRVMIEPALPNITPYQANPVLTGSVAYSGGTIPAAGPGVVRGLTVGGAAVGDFVSATYSVDTLGVILSGRVSAANTVHVVLTNPTGADVTLPAGTIKVRVTKG